MADLAPRLPSPTQGLTLTYVYETNYPYFALQRTSIATQFILPGLSRISSAQSLGSRLASRGYHSFLRTYEQCATPPTDSDTRSSLIDNFQ